MRVNSQAIEDPIDREGGIEQRQPAQQYHGTFLRRAEEDAGITRQSGIGQAGKRQLNEADGDQDVAGPPPVLGDRSRAPNDQSWGEQDARVGGEGQPETDRAELLWTQDARRVAQNDEADQPAR